MTEQVKKLPKVIVAALIEKDSKVLLTKEILESGKDYWIVPGGTVEFGEKLEDALIREIKEETGLDIEIIKYFNFKEAIFLKFNYHTVIHFYHAKPLNENFTLENKLLGAKFFSKDEIPDLNLVELAKWILDEFF